MKKVGIVMGSDSDLPVVEKAIDTLKEYGVPYEVHVYSAHRTPVQARDFAVHARERGFGVIIAAAGKAAHLAGLLSEFPLNPQRLTVLMRCCPPCRCRRECLWQRLLLTGRRMPRCLQSRFCPLRTVRLRTGLTHSVKRMLKKFLRRI